MRRRPVSFMLIGAALFLADAAGAQNFIITDRAQNLTPTRGRFQEKQSEVTASSRTYVRYNDVGGNETRSFFQGGWFYEEHMSLQEAGVNSRGNEFQLNFDLRVTNEDRVDRESLLFQNFAYREWNDTMLLEFGDIFHEFNHLTLNRNIKGVAYSRFAEGDRRPWNYTVLGGVDKSRWRHLFIDSDQETLTRWVLGFRMDREFRGGDDKLALNVVSARDDQDSAPGNPGQVAAESMVFSVDGKKSFNRNWKLYGVYGLSRNQPNLAAAGSQDQWGQALNLDLQYSGDDRRLFGRTRFQSTDPQSLALEGSPVPDFEKFESNWRYQASDQVEVQARWENFENNLDGQLGATTETEVPSVAVTYRARTRPFRLDFRWEDREIEASDNSRQQDILNWNLRAENRFGQIRAVVDLDTREDENRLTATTIDSDQLTLTLDSRIRYASGTQFIPALSYQLREQDNLTNNAVEDEITTYNVRLAWLLRNKRSFRIAYRSSEREDGQGASDSENDGWELNYAMPVGSRQSDQFTFRVLRNENDFQVAGNDYDETMTQVSYTHQF